MARIRFPSRRPTACRDANTSHKPYNRKKLASPQGEIATMALLIARHTAVFRPILWQ
jgi:hypothetical protein